MNQFKLIYRDARGARAAQRWEHSPPTNVAWVRIPAPTRYVGCREFVVGIFDPFFFLSLEFVVGIFDPCSERFFSAYSGFPLSLKTNTSKLQFDMERTDTFNEFLRTPKCSVGKQITNITTKKLQKLRLQITLLQTQASHTLVWVMYNCGRVCSFNLAWNWLNKNVR